MFRKAIPAALAALAALGVAFPTSAQQCPNTCPLTFSVTASGSFQTGDIVTLTPLNTTSATSTLLGVIGGGTVCNTCTNCTVDLTVSWTIVTNSCVSYNTCGLLQNGPGSGSSSTTFTRACNDPRLGLKLEYGTCNLGQPTCPPPVVSPAQYTAHWTMICGDCQ